MDTRKRRRRFRPISSIIRDAHGRAIGRVTRLQLITAFHYSTFLGDFPSEKAAVGAIRARHEARR
ncbi:MAG: hypothetical protein WAK55_27930 [Xanthobacteraceae bacterium]